MDTGLAVSADQVRRRQHRAPRSGAGAPGRCDRPRRRAERDGIHQRGCGRATTRRSAQDSNVRKIILDAHSREVIYQVLNADSGRVVRQVPDEAMLRLRAYTRAIAQGATPNEAAQADIEA